MYIAFMRINTNKIVKEKQRLGLSYAKLAKICKPPFKSAQACYTAVHDGCSLRNIERLAKALDFEPKDLIL